MGAFALWNKWFGRSEANDKPRLEFDWDNAIGIYELHDTPLDSAFARWREARRMPIDQVRALAPEDFLHQLSNRSGYVREFCLRAIAELNLVQALKPVLLRLNDYIEINRQLAMELSLKWLDEVPLPVLVDALPELTAVAERSRANHSAVDALVRHRLDSEAGRDALNAGLAHTHAPVRQACWRQCMQAFQWTGPQRIAAALASGDPSIARSVEPDVIALPDDELLAWFEKLGTLRAMSIRRAILVAVRRRGLAEPAAIVERAVWDGSYSIRWLAHLWSKDAPAPLVQRYLQVLKDSGAAKRKRYALEGLAALKFPDTLAACQRAMLDDLPAVRKAALVACCSMDPDRVFSYVEAAVGDAELLVVRQAFRLMVSSACSLPVDALRAAARVRSNDLGFFQSLLECAGRLSLWPSLHLTSLTALATPALQVELRARIDVFLSGLGLVEVYAAPTREQWEAICGWLTMDKLESRPALRSVVEFYGKRMEGVR